MESIHALVSVLFYRRLFDKGKKIKTDIGAKEEKNTPNYITKLVSSIIYQKKKNQKKTKKSLYIYPVVYPPPLLLC